MSASPSPLRGPACAASLLAMLLPAACVTDKVTGEQRFALVSWNAQEEQRIGDEAAPTFEQQFGGSLPDPAAQAYLESVVKEMAGHSVRKDDFTYTFEILNSSEPNAFALPGGYVYITRGLLENLGSEGEFVGILGHELGHVEHQHSMLQQSKAIAATVLVGLTGVGEDLLQKDPDDPNHVTAVASYAAPLTLLHFSRSQESEADARGVFFAHSMGYDPRDMKRTFEYFARLEGEAGGSTPEFLRSHPANQTRIDDIDEVIRDRHPEVLSKAPGAFRSPPGAGDRFTQIVTDLKAKSAAYAKHDAALALLAEQGDDPRALERAQRLADAARRELPDEPLVACLAGEIQFVRGEGDRGRAQFERATALQRARTPGKEYWKPSYFLGLIELDAGRGAAATESLRKASALYPHNAVAAYHLGRAEEARGEPRAAAAAYRRAAELAPPESTLLERTRSRLQSLQDRDGARGATRARR